MPTLVLHRFIFPLVAVWIFVLSISQPLQGQCCPPCNGLNNGFIPTYVRWTGWQGGTGVEVFCEVDDGLGNNYLMPNGAVIGSPYDPQTGSLCPPVPTTIPAPLNFVAGPVYCLPGRRFYMYTVPLGVGLLNSGYIGGGGVNLTYPNVLPYTTPSPYFGGGFNVVSPAPMLANVTPNPCVRGVTTSITIHGGLIGHEVGGCSNTWSGAASVTPWGPLSGSPQFASSTSNNATASTPATQININLTPMALGYISLGNKEFALANFNSALSNTVTFDLVNPPPNGTFISQDTWSADQAPPYITISGSHLFPPGGPEATEVLFDGHPLAASGTAPPNSLLCPTIDAGPWWGNPSASLWTTPGTHTITVTNPPPGGGSNTFTVTVLPPQVGPISVASSTPTQFPFWMAPSTIDVQGSGFVVGTTTATIDGSSVPVSVSSSTLLTVSGTASLLGTIGTHTLVVSNPAPGGGSAQLVFQSVDPAPMIASITPTEIPTSTADTPITIVAGNSASLPTYSANGLIVEVDGVAVATTPGTATDEVVAWIPAAILGTPALRNVTLRNPVPSTVGASPAYVLPIVGPSVASVSPNLIGSIPTQTGDVTLTVTGTSFSAASSTVVADGQPLTTTWVSETELSAVLPDAHPARSQTGGAAIFVRNTPTSYSNAVGLEIDDHENLGTISTRPETIDAGTSFDLRLEGCFPSVPFILFVDVTPIPPFVPWPDATANLVLSVIPSPSTALLDGTGLFGPYIPVTFDGAGGFTLPGITAPSPLFGVPFRLQAAYPDPFAPGGFRLTHARLALNL